MNKVLNVFLIISLALATQVCAFDLKNVVSKETLSTVVAKATTAAKYCAHGLKQGAVYLGSKTSSLTVSAWEKMPTSVKEKVVYAWEKLTKTTTGKIASGTVGAAILLAAMYELSHRVQFRGSCPAA